MKPIFDIKSLPYLSPKTLNMKEPAQFEAKAKPVIKDTLRPSSHSIPSDVTKLKYV